jgi:hypothetical protein
MRLYSLIGAIAHEDPEYGHFEAGEGDGSFLFPDEVSEVLVTTGVKGRKLWETEDQRATRLHGQEMARRRDPASMLEVMETNAALTRQLTEVMTQLAALQLAQAGVPASPAAPEPEQPAEAPAGDGEEAVAADDAASAEKAAPKRKATAAKAS